MARPTASMSERDARDEPGIERGGQRPARRIERGGEFASTASPGLPLRAEDDLAGLVLMRRVAHREGRGHGEGVDLCRPCRRRRVRGRLHRAASPPRHCGRGRRRSCSIGMPGKALAMPVRSTIGASKPMRMTRDGAAMAFDHRIGGERRRHRHERDAPGRARCRAAPVRGRWPR